MGALGRTPSATCPASPLHSAPADPLLPFHVDRDSILPSVHWPAPTRLLEKPPKNPHPSRYKCEPEHTSPSPSDPGRLVANFHWTPSMRFCLTGTPSSPLEGPSGGCRCRLSPESLPNMQAGHRMSWVPSILLLDVRKMDSPPPTEAGPLTVLPLQLPPGPNPDRHHGLPTLSPPGSLSSQSCWLCLENTSRSVPLMPSILV